MKLVFFETAWEDYLYWQTHDPKLLKRVNDLVRECARTPFTGIGKPEPLRGSLSERRALSPWPFDLGRYMTVQCGVAKNGHQPDARCCAVALSRGA